MTQEQLRDIKSLITKNYRYRARVHGSVWYVVYIGLRRYDAYDIKIRPAALLKLNRLGLTPWI